MAYISTAAVSRTRALAVAGVLALHALVWFVARMDAPGAGQADPHITYAELRFVVPTPEPVRPPPEEVAPPPAPRPRGPALVRPREAEPVAAAPAAEPAELLPAEAPTAQAGEAQQAPTIDMEALRMAARDYERTRERSPIEKHREQLRREQHRDAAAEAIGKSARASCGSAYGSLGLLAVIPLIVDTVRDKGCKW